MHKNLELASNIEQVNISDVSSPERQLLITFSSFMSLLFNYLFSLVFIYMRMLVIH